MNTNTFLKGLALAVLVPVLVYLGTSLESGDWAVNWKQAGIIAASAFIGYLLKNLGPKLPDTPVEPTPVEPQVRESRRRS